MNRALLPLVLPAVLVVAAAIIVLPTPVGTTARLFQNLLSLGVQSLTAITAAVVAWQAGRGYAPGDAERRIWRRAALGALLWAGGLLLYADTVRSGRGHSFPSVADALFVAALLVLLLAVAGEYRLVSAMLTGRQRLVIGGGALVLWVVAMRRFLWSVVMGPLGPLEKTLDVFYPSAAALLLALGVAPAVAFRGGVVGYVWGGIALGAGCLTLASLGLAYLMQSDLYSAAHPVNLLRVAAFAFLAASGAWHRRAMEEA